MDSMEGTKLGGDRFSAEEELSSGIGADLGFDDNYKGTRIGEQSDFEKSLGLESSPFLEEPIAEPQEKEPPAIVEENKKEDIATQEKISKTPVMADLMQTVKDYQIGDILTGIVTRVEKGLVFVDIAYKSEGIIESDELANVPGIKSSDIVKPGQKIKVMIMKLENREGHPVLSKKRAEYEQNWLDLNHAEKNRTNIIVAVVNAVRGGLVVDYGGIRGFVPASHVAKDYQNNMEALVKQNISVRPIEINRKRRKVVLSHKFGSVKKDNTQAKELIRQIEPGQVKKGTITNIKPYGAFVDLGGIEGLIHISEMSWARINNPEEVVQVGQTVDVFVLGVDDETGKISLGLRQLQPDPWVNVEERYQIGDKVRGKITRLVKFGAFIELEKGLEGLIHISELADKIPAKPEDVVTSDQFVEAKIIKMFPAEQRIGLSLREHPEIVPKKDLDKYSKEHSADTVAPKIGDLVKDSLKGSKEKTEENNS
ncbi:MAG: 30S ribosomal protein S1 [Candidatus Margulisbacteria bacterium]|nr:30S ribosomal protein S1 [Candidatus Margulisiibacteriota bacterium]